MPPSQRVSERVPERVPEPAVGSAVGSAVPGAAGPAVRSGSPPMSRRTALVGVVGAAAAGLVTGCTSGAPEPGQADAGSSATPSGTRSRAVEPDVRLAARALAEEQAMLARVVATGRRHPRLRSRLRSARAAHQAHVRLLARAVPPGFATSAPRRTPAVPGSPAAALAALARAEDGVARTGRRSALAAESGALARVLGSTAAAASQLAAVITAADADEVAR